MANLTVTASELRNAATNVKKSADDYQNAANGLRNAADALAQTWEGESQVAFVEEQGKAFTWYQKMSEICREFGNAMEKAADEYERADSEAAGKIRAQ